MQPVELLLSISDDNILINVEHQDERFRYIHVYLNSMLNRVVPAGHPGFVDTSSGPKLCMRIARQFTFQLYMRIIKEVILTNSRAIYPPFFSNVSIEIWLQCNQ